MESWLWGFIGGLVIGLAGAIFLLVNGRIMGASGIVGGLIDGSGKNNWSERLAFLGGLIIVPPAIWAFMGQGNINTHLTQNIWLLVLAGILVGSGTRLASGCTSGHGVCGMSRLNLRGFVATIIYISAGGVSVLVLRHFLGVI